MRKRWLDAGFTIAELMVVLGILALLLSLAYINVGSTIAGTKLNAAYEQLRADLQTQQMNAVSGMTNGGNVVASWGIEFYSDKYVLIPQNLEVKLEKGINLSTDLTNQMISFQSNSGEVVGITQLFDEIFLEEKGLIQVVKINKYGKIVAN